MTRRDKVRIGFTTGSAATAAAKAALMHLLRGARPERVGIPTPEGRDRLVVRVLWPESPCGETACSDRPASARAIVRKDAGDDPDVTHRAWIGADVRFTPGGQNSVVVHGGQGVGRVTRPGLPVAVGEPAINPGPRRQMERALLETLRLCGATGRVDVVVAAPEGERLALKTFNPRLGIEGGISILGTRGTVKPFSHAAWRETIAQCLDMARAEGRNAAALSTGGRGQKCLEAVLEGRSGTAFVQAGDHVGFALRGAARRGFSSLIWGGFWGKLVKMAQGRPQTHARVFAVDLRALAGMAAQCAVEPDIADAVARANTARHALEILQRSPAFQNVLQTVMKSAARHCRLWAGSGPDLELILFDYDGREMTRLRDVVGSRNVGVNHVKHDG